MKVSVVTPSFNQGRFIRDCIESAREQEGVDVEHIVVDACSTDETVAILKEYPHLQWVSEPDQGQTDAINKGFRKATGDWLMWLNADDYLLPGALQKMLAHSERHPNADVIFGECLFVDEQKKLIRRKREFDFDYGMLLFYGCYIPSTSTFFRRAIIDRGFLLDDTYRVVMDFEYFLRLAEAGFQFQYLPEPLAGFRWHGSNVSSVQSKRRYEERLRVQRRSLAKRGWDWMGREWILRLMFYAYRARRVLMRCIRGRIQ